MTTYRTGNHGTWFDWGKENKDTAVVETCFLYIDLKTLRKMAAITGHETDFLEIDARIHDIETNFNTRYWKGTYYQSDQVREPDDRANAMAINSGLADQSKWLAIFENVLTRKEYASCFFDRWVFEALCTMGKEDYALLRMHRRYQTMIPCSFTTLWEHYDRWWASHVDAFDEGSSLNHVQFSGDNIPIDVSTANAIDGDHWNGWRDMTRTQYPGQWFQVDLGRIETFDAVVLDNTWAFWDSPTEYAVTVSSDGNVWSNPVARGKGKLGINRATFPTQTARHIRVTQTGTSEKYHWSIYEFDVYRRVEN